MSSRFRIKNLKRGASLRFYNLTDLGRKKSFNTLGNKANSQIKLFHLGYNIPPSIFLDYNCFAYFENHGALPLWFLEKIITTQLGDHLAIRSSSNFEDSKSKSYAGFFKTILNVSNNYKEVAEAITACYQPLLSFKNVSSNDSAKIDRSSLRMGIIIQSMIPGKFSGVLFTESPQNPPNKSYRIEYTWGLGDKITSSTVTGHSITLDKKSGKIIQQNGSLLLTRDNIHALWKSAANIEKKFDFPQDVEFVIANENDKLFLLQTRPITAFSYTPEYVLQTETRNIQNLFTDYFRKYGEFPVLSNSNIAELFPDPKPLGFSIFRSVFVGKKGAAGAINTGRLSLGYAPISETERADFFLIIGNQARMNLFIDALTFRLQGMNPDLYLRNAAKSFMQEMRENTEKANYPEGEVYIQAPTLDECETYFGILGAEQFKLYQAFLETLQNEKIPQFLESITPALNNHHKYYRQELSLLASVLKHMKQREIIKKLQEYVDYMRKNICVDYVIIARIAFLAAYLVKKELKEIFHHAPSVFFSADEIGNLKTEANFIDKLLNDCITTQKCPKRFKKPDSYDFIKLNSDGSIKLAQFLKEFGHVGSLDIQQPRLGEMSNKMLHDLLRVQKHDSTTREEVKPANVAELYHKYYDHNPGKAKKFQQWVSYASIFMALREKGKFEFLKILYLIKKLVVEIKTRTELDELIYYLDLDELINLDTGNSPNYRLRAMQKKAYYEAGARLRVKNVIKDLNEENLSKPTIVPATSDRNYKQVNGNTIHFGDAEGVCLIARDPQEYYKKLLDYREKGIKYIIGIFKGVELAYGNLAELSGMITENGGYLAHAATIAREYNIPYISEVPIEYFRDGYYIILDTNNHKVVYRESN